MRREDVTELDDTADDGSLGVPFPDPAPSKAEPPMLQIDCPDLADGSVSLSCGRNLWISGRAPAGSGTASIEISLDGELFDTVTRKVGREDIAAAFSEREKAAAGGFVAMIPSSRLPPGQHHLCIAARDGTGALATIKFVAEIHEISRGGPLSLRAKISRAEIAFHEQVLSALDWHPAFRLVLLVGTGEAEIERTRATLASLRAQTYSDWHVLILPRRLRPDVDRLREQLLDGSTRVEMLRAGRASEYWSAEEFCDRALAGFDEIAARVAPTAGRGARPVAEILADGSRPVLFGIIAAGDELGPDALIEFAMTSGMEREADFFYSDELRINPVSGACEPFLKPRWSPDLLLSTNYIGRLWCATAELVARADATFEELTRFSEYDLVLRLSELAGAIRHIPRILCRRGDERLDSAAAEKKALARALARRGIAGGIRAGVLPGTYRLERRLVRSGLVSIIIPTCGSRGLVRKCIETLRALTAYEEFEIVCIDHNRERDPFWRRWLSSMADKIIETDEPFNWSRFNNLAAAEARGEFLLFLNDDVEIIDPHWLDALLEQAQRPEVGVVGALLLYPDRTIQHAGMYLSPENGRAEHAFRHMREDDPGYFGLALTQRNVIAVTGACLLTRREVFERLGCFEEAHGVINNDLDYCLKAARAGLFTIFTPHARLIHHERGSRGEEQEDYDIAAFRKKWHAAFAEGDPYHHPLLSPEDCRFVPDREAAWPVHAGGPLFRREDVRRILVVKLDHIGDVVSTFPAVRRLKEHFPEASLCVLASRLTKPLWPLCKSVEEVIEFDFFHDRGDAGIREVTKADLLSLGRRLIPYRFDLAVDLRRHQDTRHILKYTGASWLAGFDIGRRFPWLDIALDLASDWKGDPSRQPIGRDIVNLVDAIAAACGEGEGIVLPPECARRPLPGSVERRLFSRRVVAIHPGAGARTRQWPPEHFAALIDLLAGREGVSLALIGNGEDREMAARILGLVRHRHSVFDLIGRITLEQLPNLLLRSALFIGNNSGPHHLAAALGVPTLGIHSGVEDAHEWGPVGAFAIAVQRDMDCGPCHLGHAASCPRELACLTDLLPHAVYALCRRLLVLGRDDRRDGLSVKRPINRGHLSTPMSMSMPGSGSFPRSEPHDGVRGERLGVWREV
jgi:ADP-heptose:LPS heptosyltransferase/GT2 family glycosyltransferase